MTKNINMAEILKRLRAEKELSQKDIADYLGITGSAYGYYEQGVRQPNTTVLQKLSDFYNVTTDYILGRTVIRNEESLRGKNKIVNIPVLGSIPAGVPIAAIEDICDYVDITIPQSANSLDYFALKVFGDTMAPRIQSGDVVVCRKQDNVDNEDIAIVLIDSENATIKRIQKNADGISLIPDNTAYRPKFFTSNEIVTIPIKILGKVIELRGKF